MRAVIVIDGPEVRRDAVGIALSVGAGRMADALELARAYLQDPVRSAALVGALGGLAWHLAAEVAAREGMDATRLLQEISVRLGGGD